MDGGEIRSEIIRQHAELRELIKEIEPLAKRFEQSAGDASSIENQLLKLGSALYEKFDAHLESEEGLLEPVLRKTGPEGERLAHRLRDEHREQRELLRYLIGRLEQHPEPTILIAREIQNFAGYLQVEMAHEEKTMLSVTVLGGTSD